MKEGKRHVKRHGKQLNSLRTSAVTSELPLSTNPKRPSVYRTFFSQIPTANISFGGDGDFK
jgi:hypothetical protein